jgi:hypothetical protein
MKLADIAQDVLGGDQSIARPPSSTVNTKL